MGGRKREKRTDDGRQAREGSGGHQTTPSSRPSPTATRIDPRLPTSGQYQPWALAATSSQPLAASGILWHPPQTRPGSHRPTRPRSPHRCLPSACCRPKSTRLPINALQPPLALDDRRSSIVCFRRECPCCSARYQHVQWHRPFGGQLTAAPAHAIDVRLPVASSICQYMCSLAYAHSNAAAVVPTVTTQALTCECAPSAH